MRTEDGRRPDAAPATLQAGSSLAAAGLNSGGRSAVEMTGPWKAWKSRSSFSTLSTVPWKSRQHREIPTFPQPGFAPDGKVENQRQVSHFPTGGSRHRFLFALYSNLKLKKASRPLRGLPSLVFQDHLVLETEHDFRIILGLENAGEAKHCQFPKAKAVRRDVHRR
jgi:hypothetical protein